MKHATWDEVRGFEAAYQGEPCPMNITIAGCIAYHATQAIMCRQCASKAGPPIKQSK